MFTKLSAPAPSVTPQVVDSRRAAILRIALAASALAIIIIDPAEPARFVWLTYSLLGLYTIYTGLIFLLVRQGGPATPIVHRWAHWLDVAWFTLLVALSGGTNSIFFFCYIFAILVASFRGGLAAGLQVTGLSAGLFLTVGLLTTAPEPPFELNRFLLRPIYLVLLGYLIAYWGSLQIRLIGRLTLLREVSAVANPRFGVDQTIADLLVRLRAFYDADACLLVSVVMGGPAPPECVLRRATRSDPEAAAHPEAISPEVARPLLALADDVALVYRAPAGWRRAPHVHALGIGAPGSVHVGVEQVAGLAATLEAGSLACAPMRYREAGTARLYLTAAEPARFTDSDAGFLVQVLNLVSPVLENIRLVDRLASDAADEERRRIARDLHDGVIQAYIGLQMGLAAIRNHAATGANVVADVDHLSALTAEGIENLRGYVGELGGRTLPPGSLTAAVRRFAGRFSAATGIAVRVEAAGDLRVNDRLAAELFQMTTEGLSNIRRHSDAQSAVVGLARRDGKLVLRVEAEGTGGPPPPPFRPRSITEGAEALGGTVRVFPRDDGGSVVQVEIPV